MHVHETERLILRPWTLEDVEARFAMFGDPEVTRYIGGKTVGSLEEEAENLRSRMAEYASLFERGMGRWAVTLKSTGDVIGQAIYCPITHSEAYKGEPEEHEIGWHLRRSHWGQGFGTEFGTFLLDHALSREPRIIAVCDLENTASANIMKKIGMTYQGMTDRYYDVNVVMYAAERP